MKHTLAVFLLLCALCCFAQAGSSRIGLAPAIGGRRELNLLGFLFGDDDDDDAGGESMAPEPMTSVGTSGGASAFASSSTSSGTSTSVVVSSTSSSEDDDPCQTETFTSSTGGGTSSATSTVSGVDCEALSQSKARSEGSETVVASAKSTAEKGQVAISIAEAIGSGDGVDVVSTAIAKAVEEGDGDAVAIAIGKALEIECPEDTERKECPDEVATDAVVKAFALAENEASGLAFAEAVAIGVTSDDTKVQSVFAIAVSRILMDEGCKATKPVLSEARAFAIAGDKERDFVKALDIDVEIAKCLYSSCTGEILRCCEEKECDFEVWKEQPVELWELEDDEKCFCPA